MLLKLSIKIVEASNLYAYVYGYLRSFIVVHVDNLDANLGVILNYIFIIIIQMGNY